MASAPVFVDVYASSVRFDDQHMIVNLTDGRALSVPLDWFPVLLKASPEQRSQYEFIERGHGIHWPELDEDILVEGLLLGHRDNLTRPN